ncbi:EFR1 family ferrodoxin [Sedimentibacter sp. zth1]|uniref:EFR1 family ferrodoxin n=1 Tax=Sedimentibacter sp. zth1 TaxID=2816908 RepID=UPI001A9132DC|nr:EFR1 family ferrodoxin [Sedimentibacter sp. zth1]QSX05708.1 EFR1 family ferrodoxin [Sedimentibacter sp. zth1]
MNKKINTMYFSATDTTKKIVSGIAKKISENNHSDIAINNIDFTIPKVREEQVSFTENDVVIIGVPVYGGRVPNVLLEYLNSIKGNGALAISVVVYGNRDFDDALVELKDILESDGFKVIAEGAFIGEHSFSNTVAQNRPDEKDMLVVNDFANQIYTKITTEDKITTPAVRGNKSYIKHSKPQKKDGKNVDIKQVTPKTNSNCTDCKLCVDFCPMGSIDFNDVSKVSGICIKCGACIKKCPVNAKYFDDENYLKSKHKLETNYVSRREPEIFI